MDSNGCDARHGVTALQNLPPEPYEELVPTVDDLEAEPERVSLSSRDLSDGTLEGGGYTYVNDDDDDRAILQPTGYGRVMNLSCMSVHMLCACVVCACVVFVCACVCAHMHFKNRAVVFV